MIGGRRGGSFARQGLEPAQRHQGRKTQTTRHPRKRGGLRLVVTDSGSKRWTLRLTINGRRVERGLSVWPTGDVRRKAEHYRRAAQDGRDARADDTRLRHAPKFRDAFEAFFEIRRQHLSNGKHVQQWQNTMRDYVFPKIGDRGA